MTRIFYTLTLLVFSLPLLMAQVPKKILIEETTQASCPPCATLNPPFDALMNANLDKVVVMKYQVWWPGYDPMYEENPADVNVRIGDFLGSNAAPNIYVNAGPPESLPAMTQARIDQMATLTSPISIAIDHNINDAEGTVNIDVTITNESATDFPANTYRLITVLQEDDITYASPPGTNGELEFLWVMRKMLPDANGTPMTEALAAGESITYNFSHPVPWYTKDLGYIAATAWVENPVTRSVVQAEHSPHKPLNGTYPDLATSYQINGYDGYCDDAVDVEFEVQNAGEEEVTSFDVSGVAADGSLVLIDSWTGNLAVGAQESLALSGFPLGVGANALTAVITNINGKPDKNGHNALQDNSVFYKIADAPFSDQIDEGFDITALNQVPANMLFEEGEINIVTANSSHIQGFNDPLGGHGLSDGAVWIDFPTAAPGSSAALVFEKVDLTDSENTTLTFNYAYALRGTNGSDRMIIEATPDCGQTWTTVWDVFGSTVTTAPATATNTRFFPTPGQWGYSDTLDLSGMDGEGEVVLRFRGISGGAQAFWLDDIIVKSNPTTSIVNEELQASFSTFPNPATDAVNVQFELASAQDVSVTVFDMTGKVIEVLSNGETLANGSHNMVWQPSQTGVYTIQIDTNDGSASERVSVIK